MNLIKLYATLIFSLMLYSCADYNVKKKIGDKPKKYFSSSGFALIYEPDLYTQRIVSKKISNNEKIVVMHDLLKINTPIRIINPENSKFITTKIYKKSDYPNIFNVVVSQKVASVLELDMNNPYIEILEIKKNKTFIAKKSNTFEEEKNVAEKAPIDEIKINDLTNIESKKKVNKTKLENFIIQINDFYYEDSALKLKNELIKKTKMDNIYVKKINNKKYRLLAGPFKNFNALKTTYISLNNLGFEDLNIYKN